MRSIIITGASGYIGSNLVPILSKQDIRLILPLRPVNREIIKKNYKELVRQGKIKCVGLGENAASLVDGLADAIDSSRVLGVINLAGYANLGSDPQLVDRLIDANFTYPIRVLNAAVNLGAEYFIQIGTFWQHGLGLNHEHPNCLYAALKKSFQGILEYYCKDGKLPTGIVLKLFDVYGENDPRPKLLNLIKASIENNNYLHMSEGYQKIDLIHIHDVLSAIVLAEQKASSGELSGFNTFSVNTRQTKSLREIVSTIETLKDCKVPVKWGSRPERSVDTTDPWPGDEWLPGWNPEISLENGLRKFFSED